jgi:hypothetical protein
MGVILDDNGKVINPNARLTSPEGDALTAAYERGLAAGITSILTRLTLNTYVTVLRETADYAAVDVPCIRAAFAKAAAYQQAYGG